MEKFVERYFQENYGKTVLWDETTGFRTPFQYFAGTFDGVKKERKKVSEYLRGLGLKAKAFTLENKVTGVMEEDGGRKRSYSSPVLLEGGLEQEMVFFLGKKIPELFKTSRVLFKLSEAREHESSKWLVSIRAVSSKDASYADPLQIPLEELERWGDEIIAKTNTRVVAYDVTPKPPATIEYE
ncbi:hypothetical protein AKJ48_04325 [candidate division MSBL1 archaeon SCGC-AAA261O19]|uniref:GMP synthase C-terminal domain-containing protein n=1 Tax=candidate division MSBL1 archaeon SCGC-AAA261O19 TaxID=1698277 RepID=A0A133V9B7_9EURY|nr:hypothetical protein AKJ48_04325 [candidate division MSBL1 archaeon SCGC-AAA261O19]